MVLRTPTNDMITLEVPAAAASFLFSLVPMGVLVLRTESVAALPVGRNALGLVMGLGVGVTPPRRDFTEGRKGV